jgi:prephenate dehydratase
MNEVAVLGPQGTFSEQAAKRMRPGAELIYMEDVEDVFKHAAQGAGEGVVAIENSLEGSVGKNLEYLMKYDVKITGEETLDINLCLMAKEGVTLEDVKVVMSHPHALGQCAAYLREHLPKAKRQSVSSTAEAMREAAGRGDAAAVGFRDAGLRYGLQVLAEGIQDLDSQTRFISISKTASSGPKTSIIFAVKDEPGALYGILKVFADNNINLTKIESRPARRKLGEYMFHLDYENNGIGGLELDALHAKIMERTTRFKDLGSY